MEEDEEQGFLEDVDTLQTEEEHARNLRILTDQKDKRRRSVRVCGHFSFKAWRHRYFYVMVCYCDFAFSNSVIGCALVKRSEKSGDAERAVAQKPRGRSSSIA